MGRGPGMMGRGGPMGLNRIVNNPDMREKLGISTEQAAKIRQQETDFQKASVMNRAKSEVAHMELNQLMSADKPDRAAIDKKLSDISAAQLISEQTRVHHQLAMKNALTPDPECVAQVVRTAVRKVVPAVVDAVLVLRREPARERPTQPTEQFPNQISFSRCETRARPELKSGRDLFFYN